MMLEILKRRIRPWIQIGGKPRSAFQVCGVLGLTTALALAQALTIERGLEVWITMALAALAAAIFYALAMLTKIVTGEEKLVFYHHMISLLAGVAVFLWLANRPILPYLDISALALGLFLAFGRLGCLMVGCCHGRPSRLGVIYRREHARAGFPVCYTGTPLFPVQAVEAAYVAGIVAAGSWLMLRGSAPGAATAWFITAYGLGRFCFEQLRGDSERPYLAGFSEAQWTAILSVILTAAIRPTDPLYTWVAGLLVLCAVAIFISRRSSSTGRHRLLHPWHIREIAVALHGGGKPDGDIRVRRTSLGIAVSRGIIHTGSSSVCHYSLSGAPTALEPEQASILAGLILRIKPPAGRTDFHRGERGVFHIVTTRNPS
jgi:Prolipoprotein diacylglyceryl transferase